MWLPDVERVHGNDGGTMDGTGGATLLLHSTEGHTIEGAIVTYRANNSWPTLTVDCPRRRAVQHLPLDVAARALRNPAGGVETNREGPVLVQVELVGFAQRPHTIGDTLDLDWFGRQIVAPIAARTGVPLRSTVVWVAYPDSYGLNAPQRLSHSAWVSYAGILGHSHAPENTHGDPGALDVGRIIAAASGSAPPPSTGDDDLTPTQERMLKEIHAWSQESALGVRADHDTPRSGNFIGRDIRDIITPGVQQLLDRHGSTLVAPDDYKRGEPVYVLTDTVRKYPLKHGGPLHNLLRDIAKLIGRDPNAVRIPRDALDEIPTIN